MTVERRVTVGSTVGLHARPATLFTKAAAAQPVKVTIAAGDRGPVDARSILSVLGLGVGSGEEVVLTAQEDGADSEAAVAALAELLATDMDA
ncbi:HPr family phosphocarrier protein [Pseudonocardia sp. KRD-184]|uniref:Phosphocarrier protein HPr n=1 Tax=Pseudonocardia oceani TaxID=2792013 RepID=A0ABS6U9R2_9PSEU|nr:HPr family phosphocarrier protein [Pseudonocardia oceani]MBW0088406.1 HPr family phosphocarrier protein [Pseudonocardia oceani]MBW0094930.1 HPr family phosphocarrier protein [Pseudonocardia oceani]MBW0107794.1 HPr family phosphocarrier protein [Pseudonocardia oceani]MBW0120252.1 HPr family phosphocarrier protein [Pseudonocardia oceani]MBW0128976.1 HPr family phosphocarrier protein [Pseudonocardia oceani]